MEENQIKKTNWLAFSLIALFIAILVVFIAYLYLRSNEKDTSETISKPQSQAVIGEAKVSITKAGLSPVSIKIKKGTTLTWTNQDTNSHQIASDPHPDHTAYKKLGSGKVLSTGDSFSLNFDKTGTFTYHDHFNPDKIKGTVEVE